jgi:hypothetical protein
MGDRKRVNTIDPTQKSNDFETEAKKKVKGMTFKKITSTSTASAKVASSSGNETVKDGRESLQTPTSLVKSKNTPNITPQSAVRKSSAVMPDTGSSFQEDNHSLKSNSNTSGTRPH